MLSLCQVMMLGNSRESVSDDKSVLLQIDTELCFLRVFSYMGIGLSALSVSLNKLPGTQSSSPGCCCC